MLVDHTFDKYKQFKLGENVYFAKEIQILDQNLIFSLKNTQKSSSKYQSCPVVIWKSLNLFALKGLGDSDFLKEKPFSLLAVNFEPALYFLTGLVSLGASSGHSSGPSLLPSLISPWLW